MISHAKGHGRSRRDTRAALAIAGVVLAGAACERASTAPPEPPTGGGRFVLSYDGFATVIEPILVAHGCDDANCHGGGIRGTFELSPPDDKDVAFDFAQASLQIVPDDPPSSPLASKPLAGEFGGPAHGGGKTFSGPDDPDYLAILEWIEAGEYR